MKPRADLQSRAAAHCHAAFFICRLPQISCNKSPCFVTRLCMQRAPTTPALERHFCGSLMTRALIAQIRSCKSSVFCTACTFLHFCKTLTTIFSSTYELSFHVTLVGSHVYKNTRGRWGCHDSLSRACGSPGLRKTTRLSCEGRQRASNLDFDAREGAARMGSERPAALVFGATVF